MPDMGSVERRREPRKECREPVRIEVLGDPLQVLTGLLVNISGKGARLQLSQTLPLNTMVRIDTSEAIYLGEVCYCFEESGVWQVGVQMEHSIPLGHGLRNLSERLREEAGSRDAQRQIT
jgi:hypothetical protein